MEHKISGKIDNYYFNKATNRRYGGSTPHYHPHFEIYYMKEGGCRYFIDDRSFDVEAGDIIFVPKGIIHRTNYDSNTHSRLLVHFTEEYIPEDILPLLSESSYLYRSKEILRNIEELFNKVEAEYLNTDSFSKSLLKCYTAEMLYLMLRCPNNLEEATTGNDLIDSIVKYIKQNYTTDIKLSDVAKMKSVSQEHLSRTFKSCTGLGFNEYVTLLRLRKAEEMILNEPDKTISDIAYECGFNDGNYFSYKFKKQYGVSPIKLRNNK